MSSTFNQYEVPVVLEQYAKGVLAVSSFWAGSHKWHPYQALGEQDVFAYGDSPLTWCPAKRTVMIKGQLLDATLNGADDAVREVNEGGGPALVRVEPSDVVDDRRPAVHRIHRAQVQPSVYPSLIEIGENRGMGSVVAVRARLEADAKCADGQLVVCGGVPTSVRGCRRRRRRGVPCSEQAVPNLPAVAVRVSSEGRRDPPRARHDHRGRLE